MLHIPFSATLKPKQKPKAKTKTITDCHPCPNYARCWEWLTGYKSKCSNEIKWLPLCELGFLMSVSWSFCRRSRQ